MKKEFLCINIVFEAKYKYTQALYKFSVSSLRLIHKSSQRVDK